MNFTLIDVPQRSPEWYAARCGRLTSSNAADVFKEGRKKGEESVAKRDLRIRLALERITGRSQDDEGFQSKDMLRGVETEATARLAYEAHTGELVQQAGFLSHNTHLAGCSVDGYVNDFEGIVELKCPKSATHFGYFRNKTIPDEYLRQLQHHVWISGARWADFVSFDDRLPEPLQLSIVRVTREALGIEAYEAHVLAFLKDVEREYNSIAVMAAAAVA